MIKAVVTDFSQVILLPIDSSYTGGLNALHKKLSECGDYDFWSHFQLNKELLSFYAILSKAIDVYVFTAEYIQEHPALEADLKGVFKAVFSGARLGLLKTDPEAYAILATTIGRLPEEILYIDDRQENIDAARQAGMEGIRFESNGQAICDLRTMCGFTE
ncbi:MAG: HAD-IA family hydrolase [Candidatus Uhrbacteria bacterium]|nr:HAD-IA family hydrolase [Candidatus Uhrbacteria bacterium]